MLSRALTTAAAAAVLLVSAAPATAGAANPYSPGQVCGAGFGVVNQQHVRGPQGGILGTSYLLYDAGSKRNCAVVLKRRAIGAPTWTAVSLQKQGKKAPWVVDYGSFSYYAGPVYVKAPGSCVRFGATVRDRAGREGTSISPFGNCG